MNKGMGAGLALMLAVAVAAGAGYWLGQRGAERDGKAPGAAPAVVAETGKNPRRILYYRNPMGLPDTSPVPKKDQMGMDYVPVYDEDEICVDASKGCKPEVRISSEKVQKLGVRSEPVMRREVDRVVRAVGKVDASDRLIFGVSPRYEGWIEKVYVNAIYQLIAKGQPLVEVYSPELLSAQQEYVIAAEAVDRLKKEMGDSLPAAPPMAAMDHAMNHPPAAHSGMPVSARTLSPDGPDNVRKANSDTLASMERLAESALKRLRNWEISEKQIQELIKTRSVKTTLVLTAPAAGFVVDKKMIFPGMAFKPGQEIYAMADLLSSVWVIADVFDQDMDLLKMGQAARVVFPARPGQEFLGKIDYIYPILKDQTRTTQVRIELANPTAQIFGAMYANVEFNVGKDRGKVLAVPTSAVISSGMRNIVLVQMAEGRFQPREVTLGMRGDSYFEVRDGLAEGESVVTSANFLIDSESNLKAAMASFGGPPAASGTVPAGSQSAQAPMSSMPQAAPSSSGHVHSPSATPNPAGEPGNPSMKQDVPNMQHDISNMKQNMPAPPPAAHAGH